MTEPIKAEFQFIEPAESKLKIAYDHEVIPIDLDYARYIHKGDNLCFLENQPLVSQKPEFWLGADEAYQNILNVNFVVTKRVFIVETNNEGTNRNTLRIVLEKDLMR